MNTTLYGTPSLATTIPNFNLGVPTITGVSSNEIQFTAAYTGGPLPQPPGKVTLTAKTAPSGTDQNVVLGTDPWVWWDNAVYMVGSEPPTNPGAPAANVNVALPYPVPVGITPSLAVSNANVTVAFGVFSPPRNSFSCTWTNSLAAANQTAVLTVSFTDTTSTPSRAVTITLPTVTFTAVDAAPVFSSWSTSGPYTDMALYQPAVYGNGPARQYAAIFTTNVYDPAPEITVGSTTPNVVISGATVSGNQVAFSMAYNSTSYPTTPLSLTFRVKTSQTGHVQVITRTDAWWALQNDPSAPVPLDPNAGTATVKFLLPYSPVSSVVFNPNSANVAVSGITVAPGPYGTGTGTVITMSWANSAGLSGQTITPTVSFTDNVTTGTRTLSIASQPFTFQSLGTPVFSSYAATDATYLHPNDYNTATMQGVTKTMRAYFSGPVYAPDVLSNAVVASSFQNATISNIQITGTNYITFNFVYSSALTPTTLPSFTFLLRSSPGGSEYAVASNVSHAWFTNPYYDTGVLGIIDPNVSGATQQVVLDWPATVVGINYTTSVSTIQIANSQVLSIGGKSRQVLTLNWTNNGVAASNQPQTLTVTVNDTTSVPNRANVTVTLQTFTMAAYTGGQFITPVPTRGIDYYKNEATGNFETPTGTMGLGNYLRMTISFENHVASVGDIKFKRPSDDLVIATAVPGSFVYNPDVNGTNKTVQFDINTRESMDVLFNNGTFTEGNLPTTFTARIEFFDMVDYAGTHYFTTPAERYYFDTPFDVNPAAYYNEVWYTWITPSTPPQTITNGGTYVVRANHNLAAIGSANYFVFVGPGAQNTYASQGALTASYNSSTRDITMTYSGPTPTGTQGWRFEVPWSSADNVARATIDMTSPLVASFASTGEFTSPFLYDSVTQGSTTVNWKAVLSSGKVVNTPVSVQVTGDGGAALGTVSNVAYSGNEITFSYNKGNTTTPDSIPKLLINYPEFAGVASLLRYSMSSLPWYGSVDNALDGFPGITASKAQNLTTDLDYVITNPTLTLDVVPTPTDGGSILITAQSPVSTESSGLRLFSRFAYTVTYNNGTAFASTNNRTLTFNINGYTPEGYPVQLSFTKTTTDMREWTLPAQMTVSPAPVISSLGTNNFDVTFDMSRHCNDMKLRLAWTTNPTVYVDAIAYIGAGVSGTTTSMSAAFDTRSFVYNMKQSGTTMPGGAVPLTVTMYDAFNYLGTKILDQVTTYAYSTTAIIDPLAYTNVWALVGSSPNWPPTAGAAADTYSIQLNNHIASISSVALYNGATLLVSGSSISLSQVGGANVMVNFTMDCTSVTSGSRTLKFVLTTLGGLPHTVDIPVTIASSGYTPPAFLATFYTALRTHTQMSNDGFFVCQAPEGQYTAANLYLPDYTPVSLPLIAGTYTTTEKPFSAICGNGLTYFVAKQNQSTSNMSLDVYEYQLPNWVNVQTNLPSSLANASWGTQRGMFTSHSGDTVVVAGWGNGAVFHKDSGTWYATNITTFGVSGAITANGMTVVAGERQYQWNSGTHTYDVVLNPFSNTGTNRCQFSPNGLTFYCFRYYERNAQPFKIYNRGALTSTFSTTPTFDAFVPADTDPSAEEAWAVDITVDPQDNILCVTYRGRCEVYNYTHGTNTLGSLIASVPLGGYMTGGIWESINVDISHSQRKIMISTANNPTGGWVYGFRPAAQYSY